MTWKKIMALGVDSAQITICDYKHYRNDNDTKGKDLAKFIKLSDTDGPGEKWYSMICNVTDNKSLLAGIIPHGIATKSGWGDGLYDLYSSTNNGKCIGLKIIFIDENEDNNENDTGEKIDTSGDSNNFFNKYLKYKRKYLYLKNNKN